MKTEKEEKMEYGTVSLPLPLIEKLKKRMEGTGFSSVSGYVSYVLRQVLTVAEEEKEEKKEVFSEKDEETVKKRLKALGYLE